ncbi:MAG: DUF4249 family protein [bacterium]
MLRQYKQIGQIFLEFSVALCFALLTILTGCDTEPTAIEDYTPEPILTAFLYAQEPVGEVYLERVGSYYAYYDPLNHGISDAEILLIQLDGAGSGDTLHFAESSHPDSNGVYRPVQVHLAQPLAHYRIEAYKPAENLHLWAETVVPDTFALQVNYPIMADTLRDTLDRTEENIYLQWTLVDSSGGYITNVTCLDDSFIPLDPDFNPDEDEIPEDSSRWFFDITFEGYTEKSVAWILFQYEGWHRVELQAANEAYFAYFFSWLYMQQWQMTSLEYNVQGGLGIFGGLARRGFYVYVEKEE